MDSGNDTASAGLYGSGLRIPLPPSEPVHGLPCKIQVHAGGAGGERHGLMIGNSLTFYHSLPANLGCLLTEMTGVPHAISSVTRGGADLAWHRKWGYADSILSTFPHWDFVIFQDQSRRPAVHPEESRQDFIHYFSQAGKAGARAVGYAVWDILGDASIAAAVQETLEAAAGKTGAAVARVGDVWRRYLRDHSGDDLYQPDGKHPTSCGSLLAAAALAHCLEGALPEALPDYWADSGSNLIQVSRGQWRRIADAVESRSGER